VKIRNAIAACAIAAGLAAADARALEQCKASIDKKTGEVVVSAKGLVGTPLWGGGDVDDVVNAFPDLVECAGAGKMKKCHLAEPGTERARQATSTCTLKIADGAGNCTTRIAGCSAVPTLWARVVSDPPGMRIYHGIGAVSAVENGDGEVFVTFDRSVQWCALSATLTSNAGQIAARQSGGAEVRVLTFDFAGASAAREFDLVVHCP
jgi:hypothetical protein